MRETKELTSGAFLKRVVDIMPLTSPDLTRYHLGGVHVMPLSDGSYQISATDGHRAVCETWRLVDDDLITGLDATSQPKGVIIMRDKALPILKMLVKQWKLHDPDLSFNGKAITCAGGMSFPVDTESKYPDVAKLIPKSKGKFKVGLNAKYLFEIAKAIEAGKSHNVTLHIEMDLDRDSAEVVTGGKTLRPIVVSAVNGFEAVLMPVRV